ncbi:MAG: HAMP domain-containing histidine kinase [Agarilytica sp.]
MSLYLFVAILDFLSAFYLLLSRPRLYKSAVFLLASIGAWAIEVYALSNIKNIDILHPVYHISRWGMFLMSPAYTLLTYHLLDRKKHYLYLAVIPAFVTAVALGVLNTFFYNSILEPFDYGYLPRLDMFFVGNAIATFYVGVYTFIFASLTLQSSPKRDRQKAIWWLVTAGMILTFCVLCLPFIFTHKSFSKLLFSHGTGAICNLALLSFTLYTISQKRLFELKKSILINGSKIIIIGLTATFTTASILYATQFRYQFYDLFSITLLIFIAILAYPYIWRNYCSLIHYKLPTPHHDNQKIFEQLENSLLTCNALNELSHSMEIQLTELIKPQSVSLYLPEKTSMKGGFSFYPGSHQIAFSNHLINFCYNNTKKTTIREEFTEKEQQHYQATKIEIVIPVFSNKLKEAILLIENTEEHEITNPTALLIYEWLEVNLGKHIARIREIQAINDELLSSRKMLSLVDIINQYNHDIKTPLSVIDGVISTDLYSEETQKEIILEQVTRGTKLVAVMANILKGKRQRNSTKTKINELTQQCIDIFENRFEKTTSYLDSSGKILGDIFDLRILIVNIIKNAAEAATCDQALTLIVRTWDSPSHVHISIEDTGAGIAQHDLDQLWELDESTKNTGNAIGLQAVKRISEEHSAKIDVTSILGKGTVFTIHFPRED